MTKCFTMRYTKLLPNGSIKYSRKVPENLQDVLGKKQISRLLGKTEAEALARYTEVHDHYERVLAQLPTDATNRELGEIKTQIEARFLERGASLRSSGKDWDEQVARQDEAERILNSYPIDPDTGYPDPDDVTLADQASVAALLEGTQTIKVTHTISTVFDLYVAEKQNPDPKKQKKSVDRVLRMRDKLISVVGSDAPLAELTRAHARKFRDILKAAPAQSGGGTAAYETVKRNFGIAKAVINFGILEMDLDMKNPLERIDLGSPTINAIEKRLPLPKPIIAAMYDELKNHQVLLDIWTLLHHTGAQSAEVLGLKAKDLNLSASIAHFEIRPDGQRTVKEQSRIRSVPLVGKALEVAQRISELTPQEAYLFAKYGPPETHDNFGQICRNKLRKHTTDSRHTIYSLRHHMKDCLRQAEVPERVQLALMGHSNEHRSSEHYGSAVTLEEKQQALLKVTLF